MTVTKAGQSEPLQHASIYRSFSPPIDQEIEVEGERRPHIVDVLVSTRDGWQHQYSTVIKSYLDLDAERHDGRFRLSAAFKKDRVYSIDRLVAAANMFDIYPDSAYQLPKDLSPELLSAKTKARELFRALPHSLERASILSALGRIGTLTLKHKIAQRVESTGLDKYFPELLSVLNEAVNCRNHYVHGSPGKLDYTGNFEIVCFFTDALEFAFGVSDMIDSGWDFPFWMNARFGSSHPFSSFVINYRAQLKLFESLLNDK